MSVKNVKKRVVSLDVFRGIAVAAMILVSILPGATTPYFLKHSLWIGITFADLVFPFFLFIVGVSMAYSFAKRSKQSQSTLWGHFFYRVLALIIIGLFLNWIVWGIPLRIPGVLQLIALSSLCAAPMVHFKPKWILLVAAVLLLVQSVIYLGVGAPGVNAGTFEHDGNIAGFVDTHVFGPEHTLDKNFDPEGIIALISSTALVLIGLTFGKLLRRINENDKKWNTLGLFSIAGASSIVLGVLISFGVPVIKQMWTASFILITAGLGIIILTGMYIYLDVKKRKSVLLLALPMGRNALVIYVLASVTMVLIQKYTLTGVNGSTTIHDLFLNGFTSVLGLNWGSLVFGLAFVCLWLIVAYIMHIKKIYIKL